MTLIPLQRLIDSAHEQLIDPERYHLGCSEVGRDCQRALWYSFRWAIDEAKEFNERRKDAKEPKHQSWGQMLRLFRRGHGEENTIADDLRLIGIDVDGSQDRAEFHGHLGGSVDGTVSGGLLPSGKGLLECKTHGLKSFTALVKDKVKKAKLQHWVQMQLYMLALGLRWALYVAVCKDDDTYHFELVEFDKEAAESWEITARETSLAERAPPRISENPGWWKCKMCSAHGICHDKKPTQEVNCRTCAHVTPEPDGTWTCARWSCQVHDEEQRQGCRAHVLHPDLVPWEMVSVDSDDSVGWDNGSEILINGEPGFSSVEVLDRWHEK